MTAAVGPRTQRILATLVSLLALAFAAAVLTPEASAQNLSLGKRIWETKAWCPRCHGWSGIGGVGEDDRAPQGANLRETMMDRTILEEVIKCGMPATEMPHFTRLAWADEDHACFGMTEADVGNDKPFKAEKHLIQREIDALLDYMMAKVVGRGPVTKEECEEYFSPGSDRCRFLPLAAEL